MRQESHGWQIDDQTACWAQSLRPLLAAEGIHFLEPGDYTPAIDAWLTQHFKDHIFPVLTPLASGLNYFPGRL